MTRMNPWVVIADGALSQEEIDADASGKPVRWVSVAAPPRARSLSEPRIPEAVQAMLQRAQQGAFAGARRLDELHPLLASWTPVFAVGCDTDRYDGDAVVGSDLWNDLVMELVLTLDDAAHHRARYLCIALDDAAEIAPFFNAIVVDTAADALPVFLVGEETGGRLIPLTASFERFVEHLQPPPAHAPSLQREDAFFTSLEALCFEAGDFAAVRDRVRGVLRQPARRGRGLSLWAYTTLGLEHQAEGVEAYRALHHEFAVRNPGLLAQARRDLEHSSFSMRDEILGWLGILPPVEPRMRTWWANLEAPFKIALLRHIALPAPQSVDDPADAHLQAVLEISALQLTAADGIPTSFEPLATLPALTALTLSGPGFPHATLAYLPDLTALQLDGASDLTSTDFLANLPYLEALTIVDVPELEVLEGLQGAYRLRVVEIDWAPRLVDVSALAHSVSLQGLSLESCAALTDLQCLGTLPALTELDITACTGISDAQFVANLPGLTELSIAQTSVTDLGALAQCARLEKLECWGMQATPIQGLAVILALPRLCELTLQVEQFPKGIQWRLRRDYGYLLSRA